MSEKLVLGCRLPSVASTVTIVETPGVGSVLTPQPVHRLSPIAIAASRNICKPRRLFQPKQQNTSASAEAGTDGPELWRRVAAAAEVVTVSVVEATAPDSVTAAGENLHDAPAGNPEQLNETAEAYPFCGATNTVVVPLCPAVTVSDTGETATVKVFVVALTM